VPDLRAHPDPHQNGKRRDNLARAGEFNIRRGAHTLPWSAKIHLDIILAIIAALIATATYLPAKAIGPSPDFLLYQVGISRKFVRGCGLIDCTYRSHVVELTLVDILVGREPHDQVRVFFQALVRRGRQTDFNPVRCVRKLVPSLWIEAA
jgi:hypothetical protein